MTNNDGWGKGSWPKPKIKNDWPLKAPDADPYLKGIQERWPSDNTTLTLDEMTKDFNENFNQELQYIKPDDWGTKISLENDELKTIVIKQNEVWGSYPVIDPVAEAKVQQEAYLKKQKEEQEQWKEFCDASLIEAIERYGAERVNLIIPIVTHKTEIKNINIPETVSYPYERDAYVIKDLAVHKDLTEQQETWMITHVPTLTSFMKAVPTGNWQPEDLISWCYRVQENVPILWDKLGELRNDNYADSPDYQWAKDDLQKYCLTVPVLNEQTKHF